MFTKFCSDPKGVLSAASNSAKMSKPSPEARASNSICQGKRWERVDCKLQQRRGAYRVLLQKPHAMVLRKFAGDMSYRPSKLNNEEMHCHGLFKNLKATNHLL
jgi:hypothetical protein